MSNGMGDKEGFTFGHVPVLSEKLNNSQLCCRHSFT